MIAQSTKSDFWFVYVTRCDFEIAVKIFILILLLNVKLISYTSISACSRSVS
jgi:hypothetical protein